MTYPKVSFSSKLPHCFFTQNQTKLRRSAEPGGSPGLVLEPRDPVLLVFMHGLSVPLWGHGPQAKSPLDSLSLTAKFVTKPNSFDPPHSNPEAEAKG